MRIIFPVIAVFGTLLVLFFVWEVTANATAVQEVLVTKIIDGDTLVVEGGEHVRLLGIDTDEDGYPCYDAAKAALEKAVLNRWVLLESDVEDRDQYGRLLRWVWLNDTLVNFEQVRDGLAVARFYGDLKYQEEIKAAEHEAIEGRIGCKWASLK